MTLMLSLGSVSPAMAQFGLLKKLIPPPPPEETMTLPKAPEPPRDQLIPPPSEELFFPIRPDGQPLYLNHENTVNLTEYLNRMKYNRYDEGEMWAPFDDYTVVEKGSRTMGCWPQYWEFSQLRILNNWHRFFERSSGFGP
jgi:hypothetical protein